MGLRNKVILIGHIGQDPEFREFENGGSVTSFSLAVNESYKNKQGEKITHTEWVNIKAANKVGDVIFKYAKKGSKIAVEGKLKTETWEGKDGEIKYKTVVVANAVEFLDSKPKDSGQAKGMDAPSFQPPTDSDDDDLPF